MSAAKKSTPSETEVTLKELERKEELNAQRDSKKAINSIITNYVQNEKGLVSQLYHKADNHGTTIGTFREIVWKEMFEQIIPKKFAIEQSVFIIDSTGKVSKEVDLAIFDETYTPYIFQYKSIKYIPIEAVAVAIECKSTSLVQGKLKNWAKRIEALRTSRRSYTRVITALVDGEVENPAATQTATRPLRILCCLNESIINQELESKNKLFDIVIRAKSEDEGLQIEIDESKSLYDWYFTLNRVGDAEKEKGTVNPNIKEVKLDKYQVERKEKLKKPKAPKSPKSPKKTKPPEDVKTPVSLLTLNLTLNQILMLVNNPIMFPHLAYVDMFNGKKTDEKKEVTPDAE